MALPWVGRGAAFKFLRELTQETLDNAFDQGLTFDLEIEARADGDNAVIAHTNIIHLAARFDTVEAAKLLIKNKADIFKVDMHGLNVIPYAVKSFYGKSLALFLANGVPVIDSPNLFEVFKHEDALDRLALILSYTDKPRQLLEKASESSSKYEIRRFLEFYNECDLKFCESACIAYLKVNEPEWQLHMSQVESELKEVRDTINALVALNWQDYDDIIKTGQNVMALINAFICEYKRCRYTINERRGVFADFAPFLDASVSKIEQAMKYASGQNPSFVDDVLTTYDKSPFLHCAIFECREGHSERFCEFGSDLLRQIEETRAAIPDYDAFFDEKRRELTEIGVKLAQNVFDNLNTFYFAMRAKTASIFMKASLANFVCSMIGRDTSETDNPGEIERLETEFTQALNSLKLFCASMRLPIPVISEEKSRYCMTNDEILMNKARTQLRETREIEEKLTEMKEAMVELNKYSSICTKCKTYCASYVCPHCYLFLHCLLCKETNVKCPSCHKFYNEPLLINKTCFFGDEFEIQLRREQDAARAEENH